MDPLPEPKPPVPTTDDVMWVDNIFSDESYETADDVYGTLRMTNPCHRMTSNLHSCYTSAAF